MSKYPIYIPSKGRADASYTANFFIKDEVDFKLVVEPQEAKQYTAKFGKNRILILPFSNLGQGSLPARNWIREHSIKNGFSRHWQFDDNIRSVRHWYKLKRVRCNANYGINAIEEFTDRYENIGISGFNYTFFTIGKGGTPQKQPYYLNTHVYSACLINNRMPFKWRLKYNEDTDLCLQVLTNNLCTVAFNAFMVDKIQTMIMKGGNTDELYKNKGRLIMARTLEEMWPEYVTVHWRFGRPQHYIKNNWRDFKTPLKRRSDIDWDNLPKVDNHGMKLVAVKEIKSKRIKEMLNG